MGERIYKGTAEIDGVRQEVTVKVVNAPASRGNDLEMIRKNHDNFKNLDLTHVYDSDKPAQYASVRELAAKPTVPTHLMTPLAPAPESVARNIPPKEASVPPPNAPSGPAIIQAHTAAPTPVATPEATIPTAATDADRNPRQPR